MFGVDFVDLFSSLVFLDYISPFNICCKAGLVVLNSLNFCLSEKLFFPPSILNKILAGYSNLDCVFFPFSTLNISCHSLLACRVSAKRSAVKCMRFPLYVTYCFSLTAFNSLSLCLVFVSLINMCLIKLTKAMCLGFPCSSVSKESACSIGDRGSTPGLGRSPGEGNGNPLQYPCLENLMDTGAWWTALHGTAKSRA